MIDGKYEYFAFISYCWEDDKMAAELQKTLESYKFPTSLREKDPNLPSQIRPVFRDKTDLNGPRLKGALLTALESSRYLIVICSPNVTQSEWVNHGIQRFIDLGREEDIIPFIIDGEANADDPEKECFPPALRALKGERAIYGINITDDGRDAAMVKVVSRMFDVKYGTLWDRFLLEQKKRRRYTIAGLIAAILVVAGVAGYIWVQNREIQKQNREIQNQYKELRTKNAKIEQQNKDLDEKSDSITNVNTALVAAKDSIQLAYEKLNLSEKNLAKSNARLELEIENVKQANHKTWVNYAKLISQKAEKFIDGEDFLNARLTLTDLFSNGNDVPYVPEIQAALVKAMRKNSGILNRENEKISKITFSENGEYLLGYYDSYSAYDICIWHTKTGRLVTKVPMTESVHSARFVNNKGDILIDTYNHLYYYNFLQNEYKNEFKTNGPVLDFYSGKFIVEEKKERGISISIYDVNNGSMISSFPLLHKRNVGSAYLTDRGKVVVNPFNSNDIYIYNLNGEIEQNINVYEYGTQYLCMNKDRTLFVAGSGSKTRKAMIVCNANTGEILSNSPVYANYAIFTVADMIVHTDGKNVYMKDPYSDEFTTMFSIPQGELKKMEINKSTLAFINHKKELWIYDMSNNKSLMSPNYDNKAMIRYPMILADNNKIIYTLNDSLKTCDVTGLNTISLNDPINVRINSMQLSSNGKSVLTTINAIPEIWNIETLENEACIETLVQYAEYVPVSDKQVMVQKDDNFIRIYEKTANNRKMVLVRQIECSPRKTKIKEAKYNLKGDILAVYSDDGIIRMFETKNFSCIKEYNCGKNIRSICFDKRGTTIIFISNSNSVHHWNYITDICTVILDNQNSEFKSVEFFQDDKQIITIQSDETVKIWDIDSKVVLSTYKSKSFPITYSKDYSRLVCLDDWKRVQINKVKSFRELINDLLR